MINDIFTLDRCGLGTKSCKLQKTSYTTGVHALGGKSDFLEEFVSKEACSWRHLRMRGCVLSLPI